MWIALLSCDNFLVFYNKLLADKVLIPSINIAEIFRGPILPHAIPDPSTRTLNSIPDVKDLTHLPVLTLHKNTSTLIN